MLAIPELSCPWDRKDVFVSLVFYYPKGLVCSKPRICHYHYFRCPLGWLKISNHLSKKDILMPFFLWINQSYCHRDAIPPPTGYEYYHLKSECVSGIIIDPCFVPKRVLFTPLALDRCIPNQVHHPITGRRKPYHNCSDHIFKQPLSVPLPTSYH